MAEKKYRSKADKLRGSTPTARELEVCKLLAEGLTRAQVGAKLFITKDTVDNHIRRIHLRMEAKTSIEMVARLIRQGLI